MTIPKYVKHSRTFYWYTGDRKVAILGALVGALINLIIMFPLFGGSAFILIIALLLADSFLIIMSIIYFIFFPVILHNSAIDDIL